jgi:hypothetical protein
MTQQKHINIVCPACSNGFEMEYVQSTNVATDPQHKQDIIDLAMNIAICPKCTQKILVDEFFVYNDPKNRLLIVKHPMADLDQWQQILTDTEAYWKKLPEALRNVKVTKRLVFGPLALKEKILLARDGYEDAPVELYKVGLLGQMGAEIFNRAHRLYYFAKQDDHLVFVLVNIDKSQEKNIVKVPVEKFTAFVEQTLPEIRLSNLAKALLSPPFVSMEQLFFSPELIKEQMN